MQSARLVAAVAGSLGREIVHHSNRSDWRIALSAYHPLHPSLLVSTRCPADHVRERLRRVHVHCGHPGIGCGQRLFCHLRLQHPPHGKNFVSRTRGHFGLWASGTHWCRQIRTDVGPRYVSVRFGSRSGTEMDENQSRRVFECVPSVALLRVLGEAGRIEGRTKRCSKRRRRVSSPPSLSPWVPLHTP